MHKPKSIKPLRDTQIKRKLIFSDSRGYKSTRVSIPQTWLEYLDKTDTVSLELDLKNKVIIMR